MDSNGIGLTRGGCPFSGTTTTSSSGTTPVVLHAPDALAGSVGNGDPARALRDMKGASATAPVSQVKTFEPGTAPKAVLDKIPCPMLRMMVNEGLIPIDVATGDVDGKKLHDAFKQVGMSDAANFILVNGGEHAEQAKGQPQPTSVNLFKLKDTALMHNGDTATLRDGFHEERLARVLGHTQNGRMTESDLARTQLDLLTSDPGNRGHVIGGLELPMLMTVFGRKDAHGGEDYMTSADFESIYRDARFPKDWHPHPVTLVSIGAHVATFAKDQLQA